VSSEKTSVPEASVYRLSLYHCYLGDLIRKGVIGRITSRQLAEELDIREETVRRDMSFMGGGGRPGAGYEMSSLFAALTEFLGLSDDYPVAEVGTAQMLAALKVVFPPYSYGVKPIAYYSELPEDVGKSIDNVRIRHITEILSREESLSVDVALVACSPGWAQVTVDLLGQAGVRGVLLLTPVTKLNSPEGMEITYMRMPCDIKALAHRCGVVVGA